MYRQEERKQSRFVTIVIGSSCQAARLAACQASFRPRGIRLACLTLNRYAYLRVPRREATRIRRFPGEKPNNILRRKPGVPCVIRAGPNARVFDTPALKDLLWGFCANQRPVPRRKPWSPPIRIATLHKWPCQSPPLISRPSPIREDTISPRWVLPSSSP